MLIARIESPDLVVEAHQEHRQFRLVIVVPAGRSVPPAPRGVIDCPGVEVPASAALPDNVRRLPVRAA